MTKPKNLTQELFAEIQKYDTEQVKRLLALEIALDEKDANGQTALTLASSIGNLEISYLFLRALQST
ncbi:MAG: ankyrin repeat domain-containing protein [Cyanobacteria bacterium P01_H01_bin.35]